MPIINTLYPPLLQNAIPAIIRSGDENGECRIYFSKTVFNAITDIVNVHVALKYANNNRNALNIAKWPSQIAVCDIYEDVNEASEFKYYIKLQLVNLGNPITTVRDIDSEGGLAIGQHYKVQLRFSQTADSSGNYSAAWFASNHSDNQFSEWSKPALIKGIPKPEIFIQGLPVTSMTATVFDVAVRKGVYDDIDGLTAAEYDAMGLTAEAFADTFADEMLTLFNDTQLQVRDDESSTVYSGVYTCLDGKETLKSFEASLYKKVIESESVTSYNQISTTGTLYPDMTYQKGAAYALPEYLNAANDNVYNTIQFNFKTIIEPIDYRVVVSYLTQSGYRGEEVFDFIASLNGTTVLGSALVPINPIVDRDEGIVSIPLRTETPVTGRLIVKRASHKEGFGVWETLYDEEVIDQIINTSFVDYTAESGHIYKYWVSGRLSDFTLVDYDNVFLVGQNSQQLKIGYNLALDSMKYVIKESRSETLGGRYPIIRRNGQVRYKEFPIGGLIFADTSFKDTSFISEANLYGANSLNAELNAQIISAFQDIDKGKGVAHLTEKAYRDAVIEFLYDGNVKLFKAGPEGNSLIRLMDISLTPENTLGRSIYNFSALAVEVDDFTIENCFKYGIQVM